MSRSRNRNNIRYHLIAAFFSNALWFLTFKALITRDMSLALFPWYCAGTMLGSVLGVKISMWIEAKLGAESDSHIKKTGPIIVTAKFDEAQLEDLKRKLEILWQQHPRGFFRDPDIDAAEKARDEATANLLSPDAPHFEQAKRTVAGWPEWKRNIGHALDPRQGKEK